MDEALRTALEKLATELLTPTRHLSKDEWVRGNNAGNENAGRRLKETLDKFPANRVTTRSQYGFQTEGRSVQGAWSTPEEVETIVKARNLTGAAHIVTREGSFTPWAVWVKQ